MRTATAPIVLAALLAALLASAPARAGGGCANEAVRIEQHVDGASARALPECRAYERASPALKNGNEVSVPEDVSNELPFQAAAAGQGIEYSLAGGIPDSESVSQFVQAIGLRPPGLPEWQQVNLAADNAFAQLPPAGGAQNRWEYFSRQLDCGVEFTRLPQPHLRGGESPQLAPGETPEEKIGNLYLWRAAGAQGPETFTLLTDVRPADPGSDLQGGYVVDGASAGCEKVIFETSAAYELPTVPGSSQYAPPNSLFESSKAGGLRLASVLPDGEPARNAQLAAGSQSGSTLNEVSSDGTHVYFAAAAEGPGTGEEAGTDQLYVRLAGSSTVHVSAPAAGAPAPDRGASFQAASPSGARALFTANRGLLAGATVGAGEPKQCERAGPGCDLYEYDLATGVLADLSSPAEESASDTIGAGVLGVAGTSEDGSYVYFSCFGQLIPGKGSTEAENLAGAARTANVYAYHEGALTYVATIGEKEARTLDAIASSPASGSRQLVSRVSASGRFLLLSSVRSLTGYDNLPEGGTPAPELYEYAFTPGAGSLTCVSCVPWGARPAKSETFSPLGPYIEVHYGAPVRNLLDDGRVFLDSYDALVRTGAKGNPLSPAVHVYEWQPKGFGGCVPAPAPEGDPQFGEGCPLLLDSGEDPSESYFEGASANGEDVYLTTPSPLAPQDGDGLRDIYDVRVGGGIPAPVPVAGCEQNGRECQPEGYVGLGGAGHASETAVGGNVAGQEALASTVERLGLVRRVVRGSTLTLVISAPGPGRVALTGAGLRSVHRTLAHRGTYTLRTSLTPRAAAALRHRGHLRVPVRLAFDPPSAPASARILTVAFR